MASYPFLSHEWVNAARGIRTEYQGRAAPVDHKIQVNLVVTDVPFDAGKLDAHLDSTSGDVEIDVGHLDEPDVTLTFDYATAKAILVDQENPMQLFMAGKIRVQGDMAKLLTIFQEAEPDPLAIEVSERIREITD